MFSMFHELSDRLGGWSKHCQRALGFRRLRSLAKTKFENGVFLVKKWEFTEFTMKNGDCSDFMVIYPVVKRG
jgi:hypothetical protein